MFRILPILMVALGLFLAVTSFASANTPDLGGTEGLDVCAEIAGESAVALERPIRADLVRCWRTVGMGIPVPACQIEKGVTSTTDNTAPRNDVGWPEIVAALGHDASAPLKDVPPPKG